MVSFLWRVHLDSEGERELVCVWVFGVLSPSDTYVCMWIDHTPQGRTGLQQGHMVQDWS